MNNFKLVFALGAFLLPIGMVSGAEFVSAETYANQAKIAFQSGDFKQAAKLYQKAIQYDGANANYRDGLGRAYERQAESSSFSLVLTKKARESFVRALELQPDHAGAMADLIELNQQPIGLCEGNLTEASNLIDRLSQVDPVAGMREREYWQDAQHEAARPGQKFLCGPVKLTRVVTDRVLPNAKLKNAPPVAVALAKN